MLKAYYSLTKPGMIRGNLVIAAAGFLLASKNQINFSLLFFTLFGLALVIASGCVFNNVIDKNIDAKMLRTKNRVLVTKAVSIHQALIFGSIIGLTGFIILFLFTNFLTVSLAFIAAFIYVVLYSFLKHKSAVAAFVGSFSGAMPPVIGYTAVTHRLDAGALIIFLILVLWQMPHFYAISIYRFDEYQKAGVPVLPVQKNIQITKVYILLYILAFIFATLALPLFNYTGKIYLIIVLILGITWLFLSLNFFRVHDFLEEKRWARIIFMYSLFVIMILSVTLALGSVI